MGPTPEIGSSSAAGASDSSVADADTSSAAASDAAAVAASAASDTDKSDQGRTQTVTWQEVFGHPEPYPEQADGIETVLETARQSGYTVLEGACGTGKTMLALTAGVDLVRDPDSPFERILVLTSVKQQLRQFEEDLETINDNLPADWRPISGLTLVGKADVCPYSREGAGDIDPESVYERCEGLRERTRNLAGDGGATTAGALVSEASSAQTGLADTGSSGPAHLETAGEPTPYLPETPSYGDTEYCPFYAQFLEDLPSDGEPIEAVPFDVADRGLIDVEELVGLSAGYGTCPHSMMGALLSELEVVIGNYYHAFDPETIGGFTGALLDDSTFVICDEAHMLEPRVRDLVSTSIGDTSLRNASSELTRVIQPLLFDERDGEDSQPGQRTRQRSTAQDDAELIRGELADSDLSLRDLRVTRRFFEELREELDRRVQAHLDRTRPDWRADLTSLEDQELPLRDPEEPAPDAITDWADEAGHTEDVWARAAAVGSFAAHVLDELEGEDRQRAAPAVGRALGEWYRRDHEGHFREIELERTWNEDESPDSWRRAYNARLSLHNCVPGDAIAEHLGEFGGGVLMSATLEPLDVFREVSGLERLHADGRPIEQRTYGLAFPEQNRASFAVDVPKFTYGNRGAPPQEAVGDGVGDDEGARTRRAHVDAVAAVARSPGNVLVGMPNYAEAEWLARELRQRLEKRVLLDEASDDEATESLKGTFFSGEGKVLVTSLRGTLTEGVDYRGDRLAAAVVCGVPIINTASPRTKAVQTAYDRRFGDGFETALMVPAVRKARQAIGRVIRGPEEVGVRALVDARYARDSWDSVREYFPPEEREEFRPVSPDMLEYGIEQFWDREGDD